MTHATDSAVSQPTASGLPANVAGALSYVLGPITGVAFLLLEKENQFVRYHSAQSTAIGIILFIASIALSIVSSVLAVVPILGWIIALLAGMVFGLATFLLWLMLMWRAYQGQMWEAPVAGGLTRKIAGTSL